MRPPVLRASPMHWPGDAAEGGTRKLGGRRDGYRVEKPRRPLDGAGRGTSSPFASPRFFAWLLYFASA